MLTILSVPFSEPDKTTAIRQHNAWESWKRLVPKVEIIRLAEEDIERNEVGALSLRSIFQLGDELATHDLIAYVDADVILMSDFLPVVKFLMDNYRKWVTCAGRWSARIDYALDFDKDWETEVRGLIYRQHNKGSDYCIYPRGFFSDIPSFSIGQGHWDGWRMRHVLDRGYDLINIQEVVRAVHQDHGLRWRVAPQRERNRLLAGDGAWVTDATIRIAPEDLCCNLLGGAI